MTLVMVGRLSECLLLSYSTPLESVRNLVPRGLNIVTHDGHAFWNVVISKIDNMRPWGFPRWTGVTYHHVAYRLQVAVDTDQGQQLQGLYFLRSDVDSRLIIAAGKRLTDFRFHHAAITIAEQNSTMTVEVESREKAGCASIMVRYPCVRTEQTGLFKNAEERRRVLEYNPVGLTVDPHGKIRLAEVVRDQSVWREDAIAVLSAKWGFFDALETRRPRLEHATRVVPIEYQWRLRCARAVKSR